MLCKELYFSLLLEKSVIKKTRKINCKQIYMFNNKQRRNVELKINQISFINYLITYKEFLNVITINKTLSFNTELMWGENSVHVYSIYSSGKPHNAYGAPLTPRILANKKKINRFFTLNICLILFNNNLIYL
mgnify:CR=1 FL=1